MYELIQKILSSLVDAGEIKSIYYHYSGRNMYGTCTGVVVSPYMSSGDVVRIIVEELCELANHPSQIADAMYELGSVCSDSFGNDRIVYFKGLDLDDPVE